MPEPLHLLVYFLRVSTVSPPKQLAKAIFLAGNDYHVNMIWHQAIGQYRYIYSGDALFEQAEIELEILVTEKRLLLMNSTLSDMVGISWNNDSCHPWHRCLLVCLFW
jgi:hypothetical protein